jgi:SlyX protein
MSETAILGARIDTLEMRLTYQDAVIEDLNETITAQWKQIDRLVHQVRSLGDRIQGTQDGAGSQDQHEPPPPHY